MHDARTRTPFEHDRQAHERGRAASGSLPPAARTVSWLAAVGCSALALLGAAACGDDDEAKPSTADAGVSTRALRALEPAELNSLCKQVLPKIAAASTPAHQCTLSALADSKDEATCDEKKAACVADKAYDDWARAKCNVFTAGKAPRFECALKVSELIDCFEDSAAWLSKLSCSDAATGPDDAPECLGMLQGAPCEFHIDKLLVDTAFRGTQTVPEPSEFACKDGADTYPYDLDNGPACNKCATETCCGSYLACVNDKACACFLDCTDSDAVCYRKCKLEDDPAQFVEHYECLITECSDPCELN